MASVTRKTKRVVASSIIFSFSSEIIGCLNIDKILQKPSTAHNKDRKTTDKNSIGWLSQRISTKSPILALFTRMQ